MKLRLFSFVAVAVLLASMAFAHGDKKHVIGTLEKINADSVVVKTSDGKSVEVKVVATTTFVTRDGKPAKLSDLAVGERVVIHATPEGDMLSADEVRFSPPGSTGAGATAKPQQ
jgi:hypothetical protein